MPKALNRDVKRLLLNEKQDLSALVRLGKQSSGKEDLSGRLDAVKATEQRS